MLLGGVYGMGAIGMALIFGVMRVLNLAHGAFMVLGGVTAWFAGDLSLGGGLLALPLIVVVSAGLGGALWLGGLVPPESQAGREENSLATHLLVTLGFSLIVEDLVTRWGPSGAFAFPVNTSIIHVGGASLSLYKLSLLGAVSTCFAGLRFLLFKTDFGRMVRACMQEREGAILIGVPVRKISLVVFSLGSLLSGLAGWFYAGLYPMTPNMGIPLTLRALFVVILGGMGRLIYTLSGALFLGTMEVLTGFWGHSESQAILPYGGLVLLLLLSPEGIGAVVTRWKQKKATPE